MNAMNAHHFGASSVSGKAHRDHIRQDSFDKSYNDTNTSYSVPQPSANTHDISPSYSQATSSNKPQSRACSRSPRGQGSSQRRATVESDLQTADLNPQGDKPTFATLGQSSCISSSCQVKEPSTDNYLPTPSMNNPPTTDNSINNANNPDNRVNNGYLEIGNSSSSVSAATMTYANDITHVHIGTIHICMPPEYLNPGPPSNDRGGESRSRARKRRRSKPRPNNKSRTIWRMFWCFW